MVTQAGWTAADAIGRRLADTIIPPRYREAHTAGLARYLATGEGPVLNRRIELFALHKGARIPRRALDRTAGPGRRVVVLCVPPRIARKLQVAQPGLRILFLSGYAEDAIAAERAQAGTAGAGFGLTLGFGR